MKDENLKSFRHLFATDFIGIRNLKMDRFSSTVELFCICFENIYCTISFNIAQTMSSKIKIL